MKWLVEKLFAKLGLTPENAADAVRKVKPDAMDVCSGQNCQRMALQSLAAIN